MGGYIPRKLVCKNRFHQIVSMRTFSFLSCILFLLLNEHGVSGQIKFGDVSVNFLHKFAPRV